MEENNNYQQSEQQNNKQRTRLIILGIAILVISLVGITYSFFNYTRTGSPNTIKTGRIYFNTTENGTLNLTNVFPMSSTAAGNANLSEVSVRIQGDTTYSSGEEYEITIVGVNNTVNSKTIPINYIATYAITDDENDQTDEIGTMDNSTYFTTRGSTTAVYKLNATGEAENGEQVLVGYIPANGAIDGTLKIKAYLDSANIAISDTYPEGTTYTVKSSLGEADITACEAALDGVTDVENICDTSAHLQAAIDAGNVISLAQITALENAGIVTEYTDGTLSTWVAGREVLTTEEWNSLQNAQNPLSFKIKAEANEGVWVLEPEPAIPEIASCQGCKYLYRTGPFNYGENGTVLQSTDVSADYRDVITSSRKHFLGVILENGTSGKVTRVFACGVKGESPNEGIPFCVEGYTDISKYASNKLLIEGAALWNDSQETGACSTSSTGTTCTGVESASVYKTGYVQVGQSGETVDNCFVSNYGSAACINAPSAPAPGH